MKGANAPFSAVKGFGPPKWQLFLAEYHSLPVFRDKYYVISEYHLTWERLCHSLMTVSFLVNGHVHVMETVSYCTPERQSHFESRRHRRRLTLLS